MTGESGGGRPPTRREPIRREADRLLESAKLSSETQFEFAKRWRRADRAISVSSALLAGVAGVGGLSDVLSARVAGLIAVMAAAAAAVSASVSARTSKERASVAANAYRALQQDARIFLQVDLPHLDDADARDRLDQLVQRSQQLNREAEIPSVKAWRKASQQLDEGSQEYEVDK